MLMVQAMRWFGPSDPVGLADICQSGASEVVTALHQVANGDVWTSAAIRERRDIVSAAGLGWTVVESLPVHEDVKRAAPRHEGLIANYVESLRNLADAGIKVVTYNFMPLLDWTRTDLAWPLPSGALALRFELEAVAVFDVHMLRRPGAERDYPPAILCAAAERFERMSPAEREALERTIVAGLPGSEESFTAADFLASIQEYEGIGPDRLRRNHVAFLRAICPIADELGLRLVVHPDDPPFPMFGLPRVVSTEQDLAALFAAVPARSNGLCFCTGSLGVRPDNDLAGIVARRGDRIGFVHLRSVQREPAGAFHEAAHLEGNAEMPAVMAALWDLSEAEGRRLPMRPDHGHQMLDDLGRSTNPGYSLIGRMKGLAELRGLEAGIAFSQSRWTKGKQSSVEGRLTK